MSMMASCMALPRKGYLDQVLHIFDFLKNFHNSERVFDPSYPEINENDFNVESWKDTVYREEQEEIPKNIPEPRGYGFIMRAHVDSNHAGNLFTRRSCT